MLRSYIPVLLSLLLLILPPFTTDESGPPNATFDVNLHVVGVMTSTATAPAELIVCVGERARLHKQETGVLRNRQEFLLLRHLG